MLASIPSTNPVHAQRPMKPSTTPNATSHNRFDDFQAIFTGALFISVGIIAFSKAGILTGSTAGIAFLLHYWTEISFGKLYFAINLPFYWFAWKQMGKVFTLKTFIAIAMLSLVTEYSGLMFAFDYVHPIFAAIFGGLMLGSGFLFLARHNASIGGAAILSIYCQEKLGIRAGKVQMAIDVTVVLLALFVVTFDRVAYSILGAVILNTFLWLNHKPGRYVGR
jgi:uncharacterized membrane-anchored protein YitT (DUF2179 family)